MDDFLHYLIDNIDGMSALAGSSVGFMVARMLKDSATRMLRMLEKVVVGFITIIMGYYVYNWLV